ncbi:MAG: carboxymuconolactone decarboxylase family protein [Hyphomicrobiaceae bacterium]
MTRKQLRAGGQELRQKLGLERRAAPEALPGLDDLMAEVAYGSIWDRPGLSHADRMICTIAVLGPLERHAELERHVASALDLGLKPEAILEVLLQAGLYGGFITAESGSQVAAKVFAARGLKVNPGPPRDASSEDLDKRGAELMGELHGARGTQGYAAPGNPITGQLYPAAIRYGYGELWFRPGLERRQRLLIAVAAFTGLGLESQLTKFSQSALNAGLTREEIVEAVIQTGPYSGFPRALNGLAILSQVL